MHGGEAPEEGEEGVEERGGHLPGGHSSTSIARSHPRSGDQPGPRTRGGPAASVEKLPRFMELFAGTGRLTHAVSDICGDRVQCEKPEDAYEEWDILRDEDFQMTLGKVKGISWVHGAPPCSTFSWPEATTDTTEEP